MKLPSTAPDTGFNSRQVGTATPDLVGSDETKVDSDSAIFSERFPQSPTEADAVDELLSAELEKLSFEEKERHIFDVHGMSHEFQEPDDLGSVLQELENEIRKIPDKKAYDQARYLNEEYVTDRSFLLMFLRCDNFDVEVAAKHIVTHFETKKEFFGDGPVLGRDVHISDLSEDDLKALEKGYWQILPVRDAAGRLVLFQSAAFLLKPECEDSMIRAVFYLHFVVARQEDVQKNGMVLLSWWNDVSFSPSKVFNFLHKKLAKVRFGVPRKISAIHFLVANSYLRPVVNGVRWFMRKDMMARVRCHFGDLNQMQFELQTFGIPTDALPALTQCGKSKQENHLQWIVSQRKREEGGLGKGDIIVPRRFDILFGRSPITRNHTGNLRAAHIVDMFREKYEAVGKYEKTAIAEHIVELIRESHGRFLKWENDAWKEVDQQTARNKISHFYRNGRKKKDFSRSNSGNSANSKNLPSSDESVSGGSTATDSDCTMSSASKRTQPEPQAQPDQKRRSLV